MRFTKFILVLAAIIGNIAVLAQAPNGDQDGKEPPQFPMRPSPYQLADEVRSAIVLNDKEFGKVYSAYEKFVSTVFGKENTNQNYPIGPGGKSGGMGGHGGQPGGHPGGMGGHGGQPGGHPGGMGGHGGRPPQGSGGIGHPGGNLEGNHATSARPNDKQKTVDMEKFEKAKDKAEQKLCKTMKKIFQKDPSKYDLWTTIRQHQFENMFLPRPPRGESNAENN